jgi:cell division protein FtsL
MRRRLFLYLIVLTIPLFLGVNAWQSSRYAGLEREVSRLEDAQAEWIESNKRLIAGIAVLSSSERIEFIARNELELDRIQPEDVLMIRIDGEGKGFGL